MQTRLRNTRGIMLPQDLLRYNYKKNGYVYTGTERVRVVGSSAKSNPIQLKLSRVAFPDGAAVYILRTEFEDASAWKIPKNAPLTLQIADGSTLISKNVFEGPNPVAPKGVAVGDARIWWNCGEYWFEEEEIRKICCGVSAIEATTRWSVDGVIKVTYKADEFGSAVNRLYTALRSADVPREEVGSNLKSLQDQDGSRLIETKTISVNDQLSIALTYLYYADTNHENYDLRLLMDGKQVPMGSTVKFVTAAGEPIVLGQERAVSDGMLCYPDPQQLKQLCEGVSRLYIQTEQDSFSMAFPENTFSASLKKLYNSIQTAAIL